ncbi:DUF2270 domain-containing protein [Halosimplex aquaticum]|uniref:DUF2270 domain-containing protein n=1 Tax=Halosimplex aquaticum TaxID=3026162 RepID=A0ABD5Y345_9EURY|nr:DUF2270 domain-containing protein [Halosimplex aquaticum]
MDDEARSESPLDRDEVVAAEIAEDADAFSSALAQFYRSEVTQAAGAQDRMDRTTNWAITVLAALVSVVFSTPQMPAYLLLIGVVALSMFLTYEVRRYRFYDVYRSRVRIVQENFFANALSPGGLEDPTWREKLSEDLRSPTFKVTTREALARRLRRTYGPLYVVVGLAWLAKVTLFTPESQWSESAALPGIPGTVVAGALAVFYLSVLLVAKWPSDRQAKGEIHGERVGEWKNE